jgi:hypothetical protein
MHPQFRHTRCSRPFSTVPAVAFRCTPRSAQPLAIAAMRCVTAAFSRPAAGEPITIPESDPCGGANLGSQIRVTVDSRIDTGNLRLVCAPEHCRTGIDEFRSFVEVDHPGCVLKRSYKACYRAERAPLSPARTLPTTALRPPKSARRIRAGALRQPAKLEPDVERSRSRPVRGPTISVPNIRLLGERADYTRGIFAASGSADPERSPRRRPLGLVLGRMALGNP